MVDIVVTLSRDNLVKTYSIVAAISIWLITLILLLVMITCVFFGFAQKGEVLVVPVATLFAFAQLRQSMPGAPPSFGDIVDFVALLPCLAILSLSASFTLGVFILTDPTNRTRQTKVGGEIRHIFWEQHAQGIRPVQLEAGRPQGRCGVFRGFATHVMKHDFYLEFILFRPSLPLS